jgi:hypothetical protein
MSTPAPFVTSLRARRDTIRMGAEGDATITIRVEMQAVWDAIRVEAPPGMTVEELKIHVLSALFPQAAFHEDFVIKLHGWEILNEHESLSAAGIKNGSILLLMHRHRRPLR